MTLTHKFEIRRAFNAATTTYDIAADWQKNVGNFLLDYMDNIQPNDRTILDLGSGTSFLTRQILRAHPNNQFISLDIAENMLFFSKQYLNDCEFVCADAEELALAEKTIDIIISNMVLHWCFSLKKCLQEQHRVLKPDGLLLFSILGPQSLKSLTSAWNGLDQHSHVNSFPEAAEITQACESSGFSLLRFERHEIKKYYENVHELMHHLKATGAKNVSENKPRGLMGKQKIKKLKEQYQNPVNYEIFTVVCRKLG